MPLPSFDFDPTESSVPWKVLSNAGHEVVFATPDGKPGAADERMISGRGLGPWKSILRARRDARDLYQEMTQAPAFKAPLEYGALEASDFAGLVLPGGHAPGMKRFIESEEVHGVALDFFRASKPVAAICHGVLVLARTRDPDTGKSVLEGRRTTALTKSMEMSAWMMTRWLGSYYRTYPVPVQEEVTEALGPEGQFEVGPRSVTRDRPDKLDRGFTVLDGAYLSARWPGDAYRFSTELVTLLEASR